MDNVHFSFHALKIAHLAQLIYTRTYQPHPPIELLYLDGNWNKIVTPRAKIFNNFFSFAFNGLQQ